MSTRGQSDNRVAGRERPERRATEKSGALKANAVSTENRPSSSAVSASPVTEAHARAATWQSEHPEAGKEAQPNDELTPVGSVEGYRHDPFAAMNPDYLLAVYGERQLGAALSQYSHATLKAAAKAAGQETMKSMPSGRKVAMSKTELITNLTAQKTHGHFSANFASPAKAIRATSGAKTPRATRAPKVAQAESELTPIRSVPGHKHNPFAAMSPHYLRATYGHDQLAAALSHYSLATLRAAASRPEVHASPGKTKAAVVANIVKALRPVPESESMRIATEESGRS